MVDVMEYYGLVVYLARKAHAALPAAVSGSIAAEDLEQEGFVGLVEAGNRFEAERGVLFGTFARPRIEGAIKDFLRKQDALSQEVRGRIRALDRAKQDLGQQLGREPSTHEAAEALHITEDAVRELESVRTTGDRYEPPVEGDAADPDWFESQAPNQPDQEADLLGRDVNDCLGDVLVEEERNALVLRMVQGLTLREVGEIIGIASSETVRRRENTAREKLRLCLEDKGWEFEQALSLFN